jgi:excisionase family DNA binding protein
MTKATPAEQTEVEALWLTYAEAQRLTNLGRTTLWTIINDPRSGVKAARVGRAVRISRRSLETFMESRTERVF